jgi:asparagine synthase (glutamine-hydrolysing)
VALWEYLGYQAVPTPRTLIAGIRSLPAASWLTVDRHQELYEARYWDALGHASRDATRATASDARQRIRALLREAVARHLVSDVRSARSVRRIDRSAIDVRAPGHVPGRSQ